MSSLKDPPTLPDFLEHVAFFIQDKHYCFGLAIGVEDRELKGYGYLHQEDHLRCFESIFGYWESKSSGTKPFKWSSVIEALEKRILGQNALARKLKEKIVES